MVGTALAAAIRLFVKYQGFNEHAVSWGTVFWNVATGVAAAILILGWQSADLRRRVVSILAVPLCVLCAALALNTATGYFPTVQSAWQRATGSQPEQWIDQTTLAAMVQDGARPARGTLVWVDIPDDASGFAHRQELVYLPPAWFSSNPPPQLPAVMAIGAEFSHPSDWPESGGALEITRRFRSAAPRQCAGRGVPRLQREFQQRHRMRQRPTRKSRRPLDQRCCAVRDLELRRQP